MGKSSRGRNQRLSEFFFGIHVGPIGRIARSSLRQLSFLVPIVKDFQPASLISANRHADRRSSLAHGIASARPWIGGLANCVSDKLLLWRVEFNCDAVGRRKKTSPRDFCGFQHLPRRSERLRSCVRRI